MNSVTIASQSLVFSFEEKDLLKDGINLLIRDEREKTKIYIDSINKNGISTIRDLDSIIENKNNIKILENLLDRLNDTYILCDSTQLYGTLSGDEISNLNIQYTNY